MRHMRVSRKMTPFGWLCVLPYFFSPSPRGDMITSAQSAAWWDGPTWEETWHGVYSAMINSVRLD